MNFTLIIVALIAAIPPTIVAFLGWKKNAQAIQEVHLSINSRMDQLLIAAKGQATAEGREIGRKENKTGM